MWRLTRIGLVVLVTCSACRSGGDEGRESGAAGAESVATPEPETGPRSADPVPGVEFPPVPTTATVGQAVLAPDAATLATRLADPTAPIEFHAATLVSVGSVESELSMPFVDNFLCPNALIVPAGDTTGAAVGTTAVFLTGLRFEPGLIVALRDDGAAEIVERPNEDTRPATSPPGQWWPLESERTPGAKVLCASEDRREDQYTLVHSTDGLMLVADSSRAPTVFSAAQCATLPLNAAVSIGTRIRGMAMGRLRELTVTGIDGNTGVVTATFDFHGEVRETSFIAGTYQVL